MSPQEIEAVAKALCIARGKDPDAFTGFVTTGVPTHRVRNWEAARGEAKAAIDALHVVESMPVKPGGVGD